ncbi:MAG TPA: adenylate/guanylate cyclase domain-containing protein [Candidatus Limnocylindrales bacterium]|jgi:class 3 adenylate cyclase
MDLRRDVERRIVTILFADLVGFTSLSERLDPEDVVTIQDAYFGAVRDTIGRYGGQLEKFIGDAAMAVFGVPRGRDDDAERAVRAGLALTAAVDQLGARLNLEAGNLRVRVGVNTGEVVYALDGPDAGRVTGDAVNTAARLQAAAEPGGILVGEETALAVTEAIELGVALSLVLKGKAEPVRARQVSGVRPVRSRELAMGALHAPTIGRTAELAALRGWLVEARGRHMPLRVLVLAPPGVGKSRLVDALSAEVRAQGPATIVYRIRLRPEPGGSLDPIATLVATTLHDGGFDLNDREPTALPLQDRLEAGGLPAARAAAVAGDLLDLAGHRSRSAAEAGVPADRSALFAGWLDGLDALAAGRTQVWLVEDLHWASLDLVALLDAVVERAAPAGRLLLATGRPAFVDAAPDWAVDDPTRGRYLLELSTLPASDSLELIQELVGDALPAELADRIVERSDGNCLFIEELLRTWIGTAALVPIESGEVGRGESGSPGWRLTIPADEIQLPGTVQAIYAAQLDDLPGAARQGARRGSVAGRRFPAAALAALGVAAPLDAVEELKRRALIDGPHRDAQLGETFVYRHALLRDAAYASLARAERADLHVRLARWLESTAREPGSRVPSAAIGDHLAMALASTPALAAEVAGGLGREDCAGEAADWLERAGQQAAADGATDAAADLLRRAVALTRPPSPGDASRRLTFLGRALAPAGGVAEAAEAFSRAIDAARAARAAGDAAWRTHFARASEARASLLYEQLRFVDAWQQADADLAEIGDGDDLDAALVRLAMSRGRSGETNDPGPWVADAQRALAAARAAGDDQAAWEVTRDLARARSEAGISTLADWIELGELARTRGDAGLEVTARTMEAAWLMATAPAEVPAALKPARELAVARGLIERLAWVEHAEAEAALGAGNWTLAISAGMRAVELGERHGYDRVTVRSWAALLPAASLRAEAAILERAAAWFDARAGGLPDSPYGRVLLAGSRLWLAAAGVGSAAPPEIELMRPGFPQWLENGSYEWLAATAAILDAWRAAGQAAWAVEALGQALGAVPADAFRPAILAFQLDRARSAGPADAAGGPGAGLSATRSAIAELRSLGILFWVARGLRVLEERGEATAEELAECAVIERDLGAVRPTL